MWLVWAVLVVASAVIVRRVRPAALGPALGLATFLFVTSGVAIFALGSVVYFGNGVDTYFSSKDKTLTCTRSGPGVDYALVRKSRSGATTAETVHDIRDARHTTFRRCDSDNDCYSSVRLDALLGSERTPEDITAFPVTRAELRSHIRSSEKTKAWSAEREGPWLVGLALSVPGVLGTFGGVLTVLFLAVRNKVRACRSAIRKWRS